MKHTIQALVENKFGVLARVASLFSARGYNIDSLAVGMTADPSISCMTIVVNASDESVLDQIKKQLNKLIDTISVVDCTRRDYVDRELLLVKVAKSADAKKLCEKLIKNDYVKMVSKKSDFVLEVCSTGSDIEKILKEFNKVGIKELVRTGKIAISK